MSNAPTTTKISYHRVEAGAYTAHVDLHDRPGHVFVSIVKTMPDGPMWYVFVTRVTPAEDGISDIENVYSTWATTYKDAKADIAHELKAQDWLGENI